MYQYVLISFNKCGMQSEDVNNSKLCVGLGETVVHGRSLYFLLNLSVNLKLLLKTKSLNLEMICKRWASSTRDLPQADKGGRTHKE